MAFDTIETRMDGTVGLIGLNRPALLNAIDDRMMEEVTAALDGFAADPTVRAVVLHGLGRAFSAGFDMKETARRNLTGVDAWREHLEKEFDFIMQFWDCPKPTVAAVHGYCLAGAFELALACDLTVAAEGTRLGEPEVRFGAGIIAMLLPWVTGPKQTKELLLTGNDRLDAADAKAMGLVNHVVPAGEALARALTLAKDMSAAAAAAVQGTKQAINRSYDIMGMRQALLAALQSDLVITVGGGPEREAFDAIRREKGLKAALAWRDAKFR